MLVKEPLSPKLLPRHYCLEIYLRPPPLSCARLHCNGQALVKRVMVKCWSNDTLRVRPCATTGLPAASRITRTGQSPVRETGQSRARDTGQSLVRDTGQKSDRGYWSKPSWDTGQKPGNTQEKQRGCLLLNGGVGSPSAGPGRPGRLTRWGVDDDAKTIAQKMRACECVRLKGICWLTRARAHTHTHTHTHGTTLLTRARGA